MKKLKNGLWIFLLLFVIAGGIILGFSFGFALAFVVLSIFQFIHVWNRQSYFIQLKDFIAPVINIFVGLCLLIGTILTLK